MTVNNIIGILVSTVGVILMCLAGNKGFSIGNPWGILLCFAAVFTAVIYTIILRKIPRTYNDLSIVFWVQLSSLLFFYPTYFIVGNPADAFTSVSTKSILGVAYLVVLSSVVAFICFCYSVRRLGVTRANAFNNVRPVFTALFMLCLFGEQLPWLKLVGIALVIVGLFICQHTKKNISLSAE